MVRVPLTPSEWEVYLSKLVFERRNKRKWAARNEADLQAPQQEAGQQAWVPRADEDAGRAKDPQSS